MNMVIIIIEYILVGAIPHAIWKGHIRLSHEPIMGGKGVLAPFPIMGSWLSRMESTHIA